MKRRGFKWIWLVIGVLVISATCGFGYEVRHTRTQFEEAKDSYARRDWDQVVSNLSEDQFNPPAKKYVAYLRRYLDPVLGSTKVKLHLEKIPSRFIPIENEFLSYRTEDLTDRPLSILTFRDKIAWVRVPFVKRPIAIFQGKQIGMRFVSVFYRVAAFRYPQSERKNRWKSVIEFVQHEWRQLDDLGISPSDLNSLAKTWEQFVKERTEFAKTYPLAEYPIRVP